MYSWSFGVTLGPLGRAFLYSVFSLYYSAAVLKMKVQKGPVINSTVVDRASPSTDKVAIINLHTTE